MAEPTVLVELAEIIGRLRRECAWKAAQTHRSLTRYLLEEAHEAVEAADAEDADRLCDELGDVLMQVYLHAAIAAEAGRFDIADVGEALRAKMIRRNPHVFGDEHETDPARIDARWQQIKATERAAPRRTPDEGIPDGLPALLRATKVLERIGPDRGLDPASDDLGDRLLALVADAVEHGIDAEQALRDAVRRLAAAHPGR